jgi:uncharacterized protein (TIGR03067 family)
MSANADRMIVVQFAVQGLGSDEDLRRRVEMEKLLDGALKEDGNGFCDGGDGGSGTMNVFLHVADPDRARPVIIDALDRAGWLDDVTVALSLRDDGDPDEEAARRAGYRVWWPVDFKGTFTLLGTLYKPEDFGPPPDDLAEELAPFQGTWRLVRYDPDEKTSLPPERLASMRFVFTGDQLVVLKDGRKTSATRFTVDPTARPYAIDMVPTVGGNRGKESRGIYAFTGGRLWLCSSAPGQPRPVGWKTKGIQAGLMILERVEEP